MKILRVKVTDQGGFRSLPPGFELVFRTEWTWHDEIAEGDELEPFICAGPNGSGKSNILELLAAIFFQLEILRVRRSFLPFGLLDDAPKGAVDFEGTPDAFELEYLMKLPPDMLQDDNETYAHVLVIKEVNTSPQLYWLNVEEAKGVSSDLLNDGGVATDRERDFLLPEYVVGYSSGENEILSLPFFKMRFVQFDEYWNALKEQLPYSGRPDTRLAYLDREFSQAILLCNLLFQSADDLKPFREDTGIEDLKEFRIVIRRRIGASADLVEQFGKEHPALSRDAETGEYSLNLMHLLESGEKSADNFDPVVTRLKRCATLWFVDELTDTLIMDFCVNEETRNSFLANFDQSPLVLFQAFQVLLTLNLYIVSEDLKADLYRSKSHYVSETIPTAASEQRVMRFKYVRFSKRGLVRPVMLKELSDGEHQLLHSLGLCLLFRNTNSLFLLDEPETHFDPAWRANFITRIRQCLSGGDLPSAWQELMVTTHTPFLISDSKPEKVLVFSKQLDGVKVTSPDYNTLGASINQITVKTFGKSETIGGHAEAIIQDIRLRFSAGENRDRLVREVNRRLGDSVEKILLIRLLLGNSRD